MTPEFGGTLLSLFCALLMTSSNLSFEALAQDEPVRLRAELVVLDAQVVSKKTSQAIRDLQAQDFSLYEDGVKQHISHFSQDKLPLSVVILFDVSGSVWPDAESFQRMCRGALDALQLLKSEDEVALMQFAQHTRVVEHFTRNRNEVIQAFGRLDGRGDRGTLVNEGVYAAVDYMRTAANPDSRRVIIAITDDITVNFPGITMRDLPVIHSESETLRELLETGAVVCGLLYGEPSPEMPGTALQPGRLTTSNQGLIEVFSRNTGGISFRTKPDNVGTKLRDIIERLRSRYSFSYTSSNPNRDGKFRRIKLVVSPEVEKREGHVGIITRKGYYAK